MEFATRFLAESHRSLVLSLARHVIHIGKVVVVPAQRIRLYCRGRGWALLKVHSRCSGRGLWRGRGLGRALEGTSWRRPVGLPPSGHLIAVTRAAL